MSEPVGPFAPGVRPGSGQAWVLACRPATLTAAVAPVATGTAVVLHSGAVQWLPAVATLVGAMLLQIGSNFANDVFDFEKGADTAERLGPVRAVHAGLVTPTAMKRAMSLVFGLALLVGAYLAWVAGWPIVAIGVASIISAIAYTGGPFPLGYHGLGDVFVMLFFGFVAVCGTAFVHLGHVPALAVWASIPLGAVATNILVVNNLRDRETDARAGKRTLAVRLGRRGAELQYLALYLASYLVPVALFVSGRVSWPVLLPLVTVPLAALNVQHLHRDEGRTLNATLVSSARLVFAFGATFAVGLAAAAALDAWSSGP